MNEDLGVWTSQDCALVLIDYQKDQLESIRSETSAELVAFYARWLARTARAFDVPIVLSTIGVEIGFNGPTDPTIQAEMPDVEPIDRTSMNSFEDEGFRQAIEATGRKRLIFGALQTEVCLAFAVVDALKRGYDAMFVTDATGSRTQAEHRTAIERLAHAGAVPNTAVGVVTELFRDWAGPLGAAAQDATNWYFAEVAKVDDKVGVAEAERLRAQGQPA